MALTDAEIAAWLVPLTSGRVRVPYPGIWTALPFDRRDGLAVIAQDPGLSLIAVEPRRGRVLLVDADGTATVNGSLRHLVECARAYTDALTAGDPEEEWEPIGVALDAALRTIDPEVGPFWTVAAEEVGLGLRSAIGGAPAVRPPDSGKTQIILAMTDGQREAAFTRDQWRRLTDGAEVLLGPPPRALAHALDVMARLAPLRRRPAPRPELLVCVDSPTLIGRDLLERLPALRLVCHLTADPDPTPAPGVPTVAVDPADPATAILAALY